MIRKLERLSATVVAAVLLPAATGSAQTFDLSGGYAYRHEEGLTMKKGWYGAASVNLNDSFGLSVR